MAVNCFEIDASSKISDDFKGIFFSKSLLPFTPVKIISPSDATITTPEKFSETAALKIFSILFSELQAVNFMKINKRDIYLDIKIFLTMTKILGTLAVILMITVSCKKDDDSYSYGEQPKPNPSYENINN